MSGDKANQLNEELTKEYVVYSLAQPAVGGKTDDRILTEQYRSVNPNAAFGFILKERHNFTELTILTVYS